MHLLLDYDGVVLRNKCLTNYQYRRSAKFVQKHTHMSIGVCQEMNRRYYPKYGHTVTMLNEMFGKAVSLEEYDEFLFAKERLARLAAVVDKDTRRHAKSFDRVFDLCRDKGYSWHVFTNAHINWVLFFSKIIGIDDITENKVIWPQSKLELLKPNVEAYDRVEKIVQSSYPYVFADDSIVNIEAIMERDGWIGVGVDTNSPTDDVVHRITETIISMTTSSTS